MSYKDRLQRYGSPSRQGETRLYIYWEAPENLANVKTVASKDKTAECDIENLESIIADLKEYRQALAARYGELETMAYKRKLKLERFPAMSYHGISYVVTIKRILADGTEQEELRESYEGKERRTAIARYAELLKQNPGIEAEKDIEKRQWEH